MVEIQEQINSYYVLYYAEVWYNHNIYLYEAEMKKKLSTNSAKVFLTSVLPLLIIAIFATIAFSLISQKLINSKIKNDSLAQIENLCNQIMITISPDLQCVDTLATYSADEQDENNLQSFADAVFKHSSEYADALYFASVEPRLEGGIYIESPEWIPEDDWEPTEDSWFVDTIRSNGKMVYQEPAYDEASNEIVLSFAKASLNENGRPVGVVGLDMTIEALSNLAEDVEISQNGIVRIVNANGLFLTSPDERDVLKKNFFEEVEFAKELKPSVFLNDEYKSEIHNGKYYSVSRIGDTPWFAIAEGPVSDFTGSLVRQVVVIIVILLVLCFLSAVFISIVMNKMHENENKLGSKLFVESQNLVVATKENAATSQDQSASVKEIVATMEDTNALSENIVSRIKDVNSVANKTSEDVKKGVDSLIENVNKLREIFEANKNTIAGIKSLSDQINNIWEIVTFINSVADQAKIIAFNAELEASSAGEAGKNFYIVSTEIRRLADGIIDGTKEIKEKITQIQHTSDNLILSSESGTDKINDGCNQAKSLEENFMSIKNAAEITADSAKEITSIIQQQTIASGQILITLKQISAGVDNFTIATENISSASENIRLIAEELNTEQNESTKK